MSRATRCLLSCLLSTAGLALALACDGSPTEDRSKGNTETDASPAVTGTPPVGSYIAGAACGTDVDCPNGRCDRGPAAAGSENGYCTAACEKQSECDVDAVCAFAAADPVGQCLSTCADQNDCREGFRCTGAGQLATIVIPGACRPKAIAHQLAAGVAGTRCTSDGDCEGGYCAERTPLGAAYPERYCSGRCYEDAECGSDGVCLLPATSLDPGYCLRGCQQDADCGRAGYRCLTLGDGQRLLSACMPGAPALPDGVVGQACTTDTECASGAAQCSEMLSLDGFGSPGGYLAPGGYCTGSCYLDEDCGTEGQCITAGFTGGMCLARCNDERPCRSGYECIAHLRDADPEAKVCIPVRFETPDP